MAFIECRGLTRTWTKGGTRIAPVDALDLDVERGEFLALMGPSGTGKTTLLNLIAGIDRPTSGSLGVDGLDIARLSAARLADWRSRTVGYVFQLYHLVPVLTAYENVELPLLLHRLGRRERHRRTAFALELVGLSDRAGHYPRELSGGQEQRVAIARAIVTDPPLLVGDEPTGDLDAENAEAILGLLSRFHREMKKTVLMVTHDPAAASVAERILRLEKGGLAVHAP